MFHESFHFSSLQGMFFLVLLSVLSLAECATLSIAQKACVLFFYVPLFLSFRILGTSKHPTLKPVIALVIRWLCRAMEAR